MRTAAIGAILLIACPVGSRALAAPLNVPLRPWQVVCAERELARVERRMIAYGSPTIVGANSGASPLGYGRLALWHESLTGGIFSGLARIVDLGGGVFFDFQSGQEHFAEQDLAFDLLFKPAVGTLDPRQPRIPQATLARRDSGTNLSLDHPGCYPMNFSDGDLTCPAILSLDLSAAAGDPTHPGTALVINSASGVAPGLSGPGAQPLAVATGTGEGILADRLTEACGGTLTDFDHRVFEILARTLLPSQCFWRPDPVPCDSFGDFSGYNMTIFRGTGAAAGRLPEGAAPVDQRLRSPEEHPLGAHPLGRSAEEHGPQSVSPSYQP